LLQYLRNQARLTGTKEGCAEGDCGACTVVIREPGQEAVRAVNSCLLPLPRLQGCQVWTVEGLASAAGPHPCQQAMVDTLGSQCGYCTPGIVMSLAEASHRTDLDAPWKLEDQLCGNLCRCTGYRPIRAAAAMVASTQPSDPIAEALAQPNAHRPALDYQAKGHRYIRPDSLQGLLAARAAHPGAKWIAGATDLGLDITKHDASWPVLIDVTGAPELSGIQPTNDGHRIGAATRLTDLEHWASLHHGPIARMLRFFGARQIKHLGTLGGNLCNASPIGDMAPVLLAMGATVELAGPQGTRSLALDDFFVAYRVTALNPDEVLAAVFVPALTPTQRTWAYKVSKRRELDISTVAAGLFVQLDGADVQLARFAFGGMAATPARARKAEAAVVGRPWTQGAADAAAAALADDFSPLDDHRSSAWYRSTVAANLLRAFYRESQRQPTPTDYPSGTVEIG
jgi:xanthine dehydrogenase small subunit